MSQSPVKTPAAQQSEKGQKVEPSLNQKKKAQEWIWKSTFIFITVVSSVLLMKIHEYQTLEYFAPIRKGNLTELLAIGVPFAIVFVGLDFFTHFLLDEQCEKHYLNLEKYKTQEARKKRSYTIVKWAFSLFYYLTTSVAAYMILLNTSYLPTWLGGNGQCTNLLRYVTDNSELSDGMRIFYGVQFGKHLGRFFQHVFIRPQGNFYEYALHHGLSMFLIFFSYLMNFWLAGIFVLLIHDLSDFFLILPRSYRDCRTINKKLLQALYILMAVSWIGCRVVLLSYCCVYGSLEALYYASDSIPQQFIDTMYVPGIFMGFMLSALEVMQLFWTYHIITSFIEVNVSSKIAKHTYD